MSTYFLSVNRNKKSISIDLKKSKGLDIIYDLAKNTDIVLINFKGDSALKMGLDYKNFE